MATTEEQQRLQIVDRLFELRLDEFIYLPQLIVVGDQSSGKSSVLEALTNGLPFPRDSSLCTRFPAQIVFKRSKIEKIDISILPTHGRSLAEKAELQKFNETISAEFNAEKFLNVIKKATAAMGLVHGSENGGMTRGFSSDVLKIEMAGPTLNHFSVVDLPGLFRKPTPPVTTTADIAYVRDMVMNYVKNPRSIILAVAGANVDIATQEIMQIAEEEDPQKKRTLYVLTKPDLVDKGAEDKVLELVNKSQYTLGCSVVCNRSQAQLASSLENRNKQEELFFATPPWSAVPAGRAGIKALKKKLDIVLLKNLRAGLSGVKNDLNTKLKDAKVELEAMGTSRQTTIAQRYFLNKVAAAFQDLATKSVESNYSKEDFFKKVRSRLGTSIAECNKEFSTAMAIHGNYRRSVERDPMNKQTPRQGRTVFAGTGKNASQHDGSADQPETAGDNGLHPQSKSLEDVLQNIDDPWLPSLFREFELGRMKIPDTDIDSWITIEFNGHHGFSVGTASSSLFPILFAEQTSLWPIIAQEYAVKAICVVHEFIKLAIAHVCKDDDVRARFEQHFFPMLLTKYREALKHVEFLVKVEREGHLMTENHYYAETLKSIRDDDIDAKIRNAIAHSLSDSRAVPLVPADVLRREFQSNEEAAVKELRDWLKAYYKVARKRFVDNVCKQAIDHFLIVDKNGPLYQLSGDWVGSLSDEDLLYFAGEEPGRQLKREKLQEKVQRLEEGLKIVEQSWPR